MFALTWLFDAVLTAALVWVAWRVLAAEDLLTAVALFVAFGLLMTLVWVRLAAPDIALAEAGIGTGITGALLLAALARLRRGGAGEGHDEDGG
jgi:energy-converting hydrogenase B subunit D